MALVPLQIPPGLNSDDTTFSAEGRWADGSNMRFHKGIPQTVGGNAGVLVILAGGAVRAIFQTGSGIAAKVATQTKLYSVGAGFTGSTDVTPAAAQNASAWSLQPWGSILLAVPRSGTLYEQSGTSQATEVTQAPNVITKMLTTPQRQVLALGCNEEASGTFNGLCIRGCDLEDYTDWTTTSTNNAFEHILDAGGSIKGAETVGPYVGVWTESTFFQGQFLGDPGQTYRFDPVSDGCGLANSEAVCVAHGVAYWVGLDFQLKAWSPGSLPYVIPCPILKEVLTNKIATADLGVVVRVNHRFDEIWIFYADARDGATENSRYIAYSIPESMAAGAPVWFRGGLGRTMMFDAGIVASGSSVIMGDSSGALFRHEIDSVAPDDTPHIQSADQYVDNSRRRMMIRSFIPDFEYQSGNVLLTLYMRDRPQSTAVTKGPYTITTEASGYLVNDTVISGDSVVTVDTGTGGIAAGRQITFAGVNAWENGADSGALARFVVGADYEGGSGTITLSAAIVSSGGSRNVVALPANNAAITVLGTASKKDFRASGKIMAVRLAGVAQQYFRLGKPIFDATPMGER